MVFWWMPGEYDLYKNIVNSNDQTDCSAEHPCGTACVNFDRYPEHLATALRNVNHSLTQYGFMFDEVRECSCFNFDKTDTFHWVAVVLLVVVFALIGYYLYRKLWKPKAQNASATAPMYEMQETVFDGV